MAKFEAAPPIGAVEWFNAPIAPTLTALRGKVGVLEAFR